MIRQLLQRLRPAPGDPPPPLVPVLDRLRLVSVHIPKNAGTSFRRSLKAVYGEEAVIRLDKRPGNDVVKINQEVYTGSELPDGVQVIHGHFNPRQLHERFPVSREAPHITWVRDPVERVISNYYYLEKILREELDEEAKGLNILSKMQRSLMEYASSDLARDRQHRFLAGMDLEDFEFVGVQEYYDEDFADLAGRFSWDVAAPERVNVTGSTKAEVSKELRKQIEELNPLDALLYQRALHLRARRKSAPNIHLISIHVPKTAGTSFYKTLREVYGTQTTLKIRREDFKRTLDRYGTYAASLGGDKSVIHGHVYYPEIAELHRAHDAKLIAWLRDPVERVISNFRFFKAGLVPPIRNPQQYLKNAHRIDESLLTYAQRDETRNRMSKFLEGVDLEELFFVGLQEHYAEDLKALGRLLDWPKTETHRLNVSRTGSGNDPVTDEERERIAELNAEDVALYARALDLRARRLENAAG